MLVNQANLRGLNVTFSTAYNKAFDGVKSNYEKMKSSERLFTRGSMRGW